MNNLSELEELRVLKAQGDKQTFMRVFKKYISNVVCSMTSVSMVASASDQLYATIFTQFQKKYDFKSKNVITTKFNTTQLVIEAVMNPYLIVNLEPKEFTQYIKHEVIHLLSLHQTRIGSLAKVIPTTYCSITADLVANKLLEKELGEEPLYKGFITTESLKEDFDVSIEVNDDTTIEILIHEVYDKLSNSPKFRQRMNQNQQEQGGQGQQQTQQGQGGQSNGGQEGQQGNSGQQGGQSQQGQEQSNGGGVKRDKNGDVTDADKYAGAEDGLDSKDGNDKKIVEQIAKGIGKRSAQTQAGRGFGSGTLEELLKVLLAPPVIDWKTLLRQYMTSRICGIKRDKNRMNRKQPNRYELRGKKRDSEVDVVVAVDVSGSVGEEALNKFFNEIFAIVNGRVTEITVLNFTSKIDKEYKAKSKKDIDLNITCGGTAFSPVFEYMRKRNRKESILILCTDGYGEEQLDSRRVTHQATIFVLSEPKNCLSLKGENLPRNTKVISIQNK